MKKCIICGRQYIGNDICPFCQYRIDIGQCAIIEYVNMRATGKVVWVDSSAHPTLKTHTIVSSQAFSEYTEDMKNRPGMVMDYMSSYQQNRYVFRWVYHKTVWDAVVNNPTIHVSTISKRLDYMFPNAHMFGAPCQAAGSVRCEVYTPLCTFCPLSFPEKDCMYSVYKNKFDDNEYETVVELARQTRDTPLDTYVAQQFKIDDPVICNSSSVFSWKSVWKHALDAWNSAKL